MDRTLSTDMEAAIDTVEDAIVRCAAVERYLALCFRDRVREMDIITVFPNLGWLA